MSTTQHTSHYNLPTFGDNPNDRPSWRGDFTDAMTTIDNQMYTNATNITTATAAANNATTAAQQAKESADNAAELAQTNKTNIAEQASYFSALGVTSVQTAQNLMSTINGKAENTALTALQGTVSSLSNRVDGKADASQVYTKAQADTTFTKQGGYAGTAQTLNANINEVSNNLTELLEALKPVEVLNKNFNFHGIGAGNSGRANARVFAIPGCKIALARVLIMSGNTDNLFPGKWPGSPLGAGNPDQPTTEAIADNTPVVIGSIPEAYRPSVPFRAYEAFSLEATTPWGLAMEIWPNGDIQVFKFSDGTIPSNKYLTCPGVNLVWTYGQSGV